MKNTTMYEIDGTHYKLEETDNAKCVYGKDYNYLFNKKNGQFIRFGKSAKDDPDFAPTGPELLDIEITTICNGIPNKQGVSSPCPFCYKSNTMNGIYMPFEKFKTIFDKIPKTLTQIAFGADSTATSNPDLWKMMDYCRQNGVIPNITVAHISDEIADKLVAHCGAVAVSRYANKDICYESVKKLSDRGLEQVNIHQLVSEETYDQIIETLHDIKNDSRLKGLNAIVLLSLKHKGRGTGYTSLSQEKFKFIADYCLENKINFGMDSCSANKFLTSIKDRKDYKNIERFVEPCESGLFSWYINTEGIAFPCSFTEEIENWTIGIDMLNITDFFKDVWYNERVIGWRNTLIKNVNCDNNCRLCPKYNV